MNSAIKLNQTERRKYERRLPLWEAAYWTSNGKDKAMLKKKIDEARSILKLKPFDYQPKVKEKVKPIRVNKEHGPKGYREKLEKRSRGRAKIEFNIDEVLAMKNIDKMSDADIYRMMGISKTTFWQFRSENIDIIYELKDERKLTPKAYCDIKNSTVITDRKISAMYNMKEEAVQKFKKSKIKEVWVMNEISKGNQDKREKVELYIDVMNKYGYSITSVSKTLMMPDATLNRWIVNNAEKKYYPKNPMELTPEIYCHEKNYNNLSDEAIKEKYNLKCVQKISRLKAKYIEIKYVKKD